MKSQYLRDWPWGYLGIRCIGGLVLGYAGAHAGLHNVLYSRCLTVVGEWPRTGHSPYTWGRLGPTQSVTRSWLTATLRTGLAARGADCFALRRLRTAGPPDPKAQEGPPRNYTNEHPDYARRVRRRGHPAHWVRRRKRGTRAKRGTSGAIERGPQHHLFLGRLELRVRQRLPLHRLFS